MSEPSGDVGATHSYWPPAEGADVAGPTLIVIDGDRSTRCALPRNGKSLIGRGDEADLQLADQHVSRKHARIVVADGQARLTDLESHTGTLVNGERLRGTVTLASGDVITIGDATLVVRGATRVAGGRTPLDATQLRGRIDEELARAAGYERATTLAVIALGEPAPESDVAAAALLAALRPLDQVAALGSGQLLALLPELGTEESAAAASLVVTALAPHAPGLRVGLASFPDDGCDADTLLSAARAALAGCAPGRHARAADVEATLAIGERRIVVADPALVRLYALIGRLARTELPVLVLGESGAGKENAAFAVHAWSSRAAGPFVPLNCAALPENLVESELFGHEKGAFSGAVAAKPGWLERADGGTVFLDEVSELSLAAQAKLLRVLEDKRLTRVGDTRERAVDLRVVAATNRDLTHEVAAGRFREDLYFRLGGATVVLPPLRDRPREVPLLARRFVAQLVARMGRAELAIAPAAMQALGAYRWPGNVRELKHVLEYAVALVDGDTLEVWHLPDKVLGLGATPAATNATAPAASAVPSGVAGAMTVPPPDSSAAAATPTRAAPFRPLSDELRELERRRMVEALRAAGGVQRLAAELIGMPLRTFAVKYKQYQLRER